MSVKNKSKRLKVEALRKEGTLNPVPEDVLDPKFHENEFFDPHDIVQVKYDSTAYRGRRTTRPRPALRTPALPGWRHRSAGRAGRTSFEARHWRSSNSGSLRANPCERVSLRSWCGRSSTSTSTPGRSSERSLEKNSQMSSATYNSRSHPWSWRSTKLCAGRPSGTRCRPKLVPDCCSFSAAACAGGRGRWLPCVHRSGQLAVGHRAGRYRKSTGPSFTSSPPWSLMPILTEQHCE